MVGGKKLLLKQLLKMLKKGFYLCLLKKEN